MQEFTVKYAIDEDELGRLETLVEHYKPQFPNATPQSVFEALMLSGSKWDINEKISYAEWQAGFISSDELDERRKAWKQDK